MRPGEKVPMAFVEALGLFEAQRRDPPSSFRRGDILLRGLRIELLAVEFAAEAIHLTVAVPDRDHGHVIPLTFNVSFGPTESDDEYAEKVKGAIGNIVAHELSELLLVKGRREDPHAPLTFEFTVKVSHEP